MRLPSSPFRAAPALVVLAVACTQPDIRSEPRDASQEPSNQDPSPDAGSDMDGSAVHDDGDASLPLRDGGDGQQENDAEVSGPADAGSTDGGVDAGPVTDGGVDAGDDASSPPCD